MNKENLEKYVKKEQELIDKEYELVSLISKLRKKQNISQRALAKMIDIKQPSLVRIENNNNSPKLNTYIKILDALGYEIKIEKLK